MKKFSLLLMVLMAYCASVTAQSSVPVPADPDVSQFAWYDYAPYQFPDGTLVITDSWFYIAYGQDLSGNLVATDYPGIEAEIGAMIAGETLDYTILDKDKFSYSIYTDFDEIFVFNPEEYVEFTEPTTDVFIFNLEQIEQTGSTPSGNFEFWGPHFPNRTNRVEGFDGLEPFFQWRIGIQCHYTVDGVTTSSNIVYLEVYPKPVSMLGDVNNDGYVNISDATTLIDYLLNPAGLTINKFNADVADDSSINISDVTALIDMLLAS